MTFKQGEGYIACFIWQMVLLKISVRILSELLSCWKPQELIFELYIDGVNNPMHCYVHCGGTHPSYQTSHPLEIISSEDGQSNTDLKNKFQR